LIVTNGDLPMPVTRLRRGLTRLLGIGHLAFSLAWIFPLHGTPLPGRLNVAHVLATSVPIWAIGFGITAVLLLVASTRRAAERLSWWGHATGVIVTMAFAGASGASAALAQPLGSFLPALAFVLFSGAHLILQRYYKARGG
jgi:hypothetical protein